VNSLDVAVLNEVGKLLTAYLAGDLTKVVTVNMQNNLNKEEIAKEEFAAMQQKQFGTGGSGSGSGNGRGRAAAATSPQPQPQPAITQGLDITDQLGDDNNKNNNNNNNNSGSFAVPNVVALSTAPSSSSSPPPADPATTANASCGSGSGSGETTLSIPVTGETWVEVARLSLVGRACEEIGMSRPEQSHAVRGQGAGSFASIRGRDHDLRAMAGLRQRLGDGVREGKMGGSSSSSRSSSSRSSNPSTVKKNKVEKENKVVVRLPTPSLPSTTTTHWTFYLHNIRSMSTNSGGPIKDNINKALRALEGSSDSIFEGGGGGRGGRGGSWRGALARRFIRGMRLGRRRPLR